MKFAQLDIFCITVREQFEVLQMCAKFFGDDDDELTTYGSPIQAALNAQKQAAMKSKQLQEEFEVFCAETANPAATEFAQKIADVWSKKMDPPSLNRVLAAYKGRGLNAKTLRKDLERQGLPKNIVEDTVRMYNQMGRVGPH